MLFRRKKNYVKEFSVENSDSKIQVYGINGKTKDAIIARMYNNLYTNGNLINSGGNVSSLGMKCLLASSGAGAIGLSTAYSGTLFMATTSVSSLMKIGNGYSSAIQGAKGITGHAPFVPAQGAIMSVAAPLVAYQIFSNIAMMKQFDKINGRLDSMENNITKMFSRQEIGIIGEINAISIIVDNIIEQYKNNGHINEDMIVRLAIAEKNILAIIERYKLFLSMEFDSTTIDYTSVISMGNKNISEYNFLKFDSNAFVYASMVDIKIKYIRALMSLQDDPKNTNIAIAWLVDTMNQYKSLWNKIKNKPVEIEDGINKLYNEMNNKGFWDNVSSFFTGDKRKAKSKINEINVVINKSDSKYMYDNVEQANKLYDAINNTLNNNSENDKEAKLLYWNDENGEHSLYTYDEF